MTWPNSWKNVTASWWLMSAGAAPPGFGKLHSMAAIGTRREPSGIFAVSRMLKTAACLYFPSRG